MTGSWREQAACSGNPEPLWDLEVDGETKKDQAARHSRARLICVACPVRDNCWAEAKTTRRKTEGVWGGQLWLGVWAEKDRTTPVPSPSRHGGPHGAGQHRKAGETPCDPCLAGEREYQNAARQARRERARQQVPA